MTRKWKDNEAVKIKYRWLYTLGASFMIFMSTLDVIIERYNAQDFLNIGLGVFVLWGIWLGGLYKIMRKIHAWKIKRDDNKFDYFHT
jgi:hypothetical protein